MRTILILSILLMLQLSGLGRSAIARSDAADAANAAGAANVSSRVHTSPGSTILSLRDESGTGFTKPVLRLVALPPGVTRARVRIVDGTGGGGDGTSANASPSPLEVTAGKLFIMRGLPLLPVTLAPKAEPTAAKSAPTLPRSVDVEITYETPVDEARVAGAGDAAPTSAAALAHSHGFFATLSDVIAREDADARGKTSAPGGATQEGSYLIITDPNFLDAIEPLATWKREKGLDVVVATTNETGFSNTQIHDYISRLYHESANPPE